MPDLTDAIFIGLFILLVPLGFLIPSLLTDSGDNDAADTSSFSLFIASLFILALGIITLVASLWGEFRELWFIGGLGILAFALYGLRRWKQSLAVRPKRGQ